MKQEGATLLSSDHVGLVVPAGVSTTEGDQCQHDGSYKQQTQVSASLGQLRNLSPSLGHFIGWPVIGRYRGGLDRLLVRNFLFCRQILDILRVWSPLFRSEEFVSCHMIF